MRLARAHVRGGLVRLLLVPVDAEIDNALAPGARWVELRIGQPLHVFDDGDGCRHLTFFCGATT